MRETDTITVLICVHSPDHEHDMLLQRALESLTRQSYDDFDVVVVMDECHEDTEMVVEGYKDVLDISIFKRLHKQGLANAKNFGLSKCSGDWIAYLDADDQWMDCKLEVQRYHMIMLSNLKIDLCFTEAWDNIDGLLRPNCFQVGQYRTHEDITERLLVENVLCHGSAMIKKSVLDELGGYSADRRWLGREDWELWARAAKAGYRFYKVPERLYIYSLGTGVAR